MAKDLTREGCPETQRELLRRDSKHGCPSRARFPPRLTQHSIKDARRQKGKGVSEQITPNGEGRPRKVQLMKRGEPAPAGAEAGPKLRRTNTYENEPSARGWENGAQRCGEEVDSGRSCCD